MKSRPNTDDGEGVRSALRERLKKTNSLRGVAYEVGLSWATVDALDGRFPIFDSIASRVSAALDEFIGRAGEAKRMVEAARRILSSVAESMTEHAYQELASALESPPRIADRTAGFDRPGREHTVGDAIGLRRDR